MTPCLDSLGMTLLELLKEKTGRVRRVNQPPSDREAVIIQF